jgi:hypothetical protein
VHAQGEQMPLIQLFDMGVRTLRGSDVLAAPTAASLLPFHRISPPVIERADLAPEREPLPPLLLLVCEQ